MTNLFQIFHDYVAILIGLAAGAIAHFGRMMSQGVSITWRQCIGYLMQLGLVGIAAAFLTRVIGIESADFRALTAGIMAVSANEFIQWAKREGWLSLISRFAFPPPSNDSEKGSEK